ncbi:MAG: beta-lactamase family protein, partial [Saprospiraceae bacterium]|nr:beta-lactamase family protein [Saprospiraceae bacterium]
HLLSQSVGVTEHAYSNLVDRDLSIDNLIPYINKLYVRDSTGITYAYQNATYGLIEKVIEKATGMTYKEALRTFVLDPLGMNHTNMSMEGIIESHNYCNGHKARRKPAGFAPIDISTHYYNVVSAGGVNSNLEDMEKWLQAVMGYAPDVLSEQVRNRAFYPYIWSGSASKYFNRWPEYSDSYYAWGWRRLQVGNRMLVHHGGLVNGFRTEIAFDPVENIGIVCLFNSTCDYSNQIISDFFMSWQQSMYDYTIQKVPPLNVIMKPIPIVSNVAP